MRARARSRIATRAPALPAALCGLALAACGSFQDPDIVVDLRVVAMQATVPEQVIDVDLQDPPPPEALLAQLVPSDVCALVADPGAERALRWQMTLCPLTDDDRCDDGDPQALLGRGTIADPDDTPVEPALCATVNPDGDLLGVVLAALDDDAFGGLQGIDYEVQLAVGGAGADPALDQYAAKALRVAARLPPEREANHNPSLAEIDVAIDGAAAVALPLGRCVDQAAPLQVAAGVKVRLTPVEPEGAREPYVLPTLDGGSESFTESLTYQWLAGAGEFSAGSTGGPRDAFGNPAPLFTDWTAPEAKALAGRTLVPLWIVQRDERLGVHWYESCVRVEP